MVAESAVRRGRIPPATGGDPPSAADVGAHRHLVVSERLRLRRRELGLTQKEVVARLRALGVSTTNKSLSALEHGAGLDLAKLPELARALDCTLTWLVGLTEVATRWEPDDPAWPDGTLARRSAEAATRASSGGLGPGSRPPAGTTNGGRPGGSAPADGSAAGSPNGAGDGAPGGSPDRTPNASPAGSPERASGRAPDGSPGGSPDGMRTTPPRTGRPAPRILGPLTP